MNGRGGKRAMRAPTLHERRAVDEQAERLRQRFAKARAAARATGRPVPQGIERAAGGASRPGGLIARQLVNLKAAGLSEAAAHEFISGYYGDLVALTGALWSTQAPRRPSRGAAA